MGEQKTILKLENRDSFMKKHPKIEVLFSRTVTSNSLNTKIGLDTPILVYLIAYPYVYREMAKKVFEREGIFYVHEISLRNNIEIEKILLEEYGHKKGDVDKEIRDFLKKYNIQEVKTKPHKRDLAKAREQTCKNAGIDAHPPDSIMISDFIEEGIGTVLSEDGSYIESAKHLGLNAERILFKLDPKVQKRLGSLPHFKIKNKGHK